MVLLLRTHTKNAKTETVDRLIQSYGRSIAPNVPNADDLLLVYINVQFASAKTREFIMFQGFGEDVKYHFDMSKL